MYGAELYRRLRDGDGRGSRRGTKSGRSAWPRPSPAMEELERQAGWAQTFGLPLELISAREAQDRFPLMSHRRRAGRRLAAHRRLAGPVRPGAGAGRRGPSSAVPRSAAHPGRRDRRGSGHADPPHAAGHRRHRRARRRARREIATEVVVNAGGMFAPEIGRMVGRHRARSSRWPTSTCSPTRSRASTPACPSCATRTTSSTSARRSAGCAWAATSATRRRGRSTASRPTSTASSWRRTCLASSRSWRAPSGGCRPWPTRGVQPGHQRAGGVHPGQRVHPRRERGPRLLRRGRVLRPRDRGRRRHRPPDGELDRRRRAGAGPLEDGHPPVRAGLPIAVVHAGPIHRDLRDLLRHPLPQRGAPVRPAAADGARLRAPRRASGAVFGEKSGWERPNWFEPNADDPRFGGRAALEALRPRGWAGQHWSPAIAAEALATRAGRRPVRRDLVRQAGGQRARGGRGPAARRRQRHRPAGRLDRLHPAAGPARRDPGGPDRHPAWPTTRFLLVTGTAYGNHDAALAADATCPTTGRSRSATSPPPRVCYGLWGPRARDILAPLTRATTCPTPASRT